MVIGDNGERGSWEMGDFESCEVKVIYFEDQWKLCVYHRELVCGDISEFKYDPGFYRKKHKHQIEQILKLNGIIDEDVTIKTFKDYESDEMIHFHFTDEATAQKVADEVLLPSLMMTAMAKV